MFSPLQIASCAVHYSGALLLEARDGMLLDDQLQPMRVAPTTITAPMLAAASHEDDYGDDFGADDHGFDDMDFGPAPMEDNDMPQTGGEMRQQEAGPGGAHVLEAAEEPEEEENEEFEPYKPLNPNDIGALASKPFKKSRNVSRKPKTKTAQAAVTGALLDGLLTLPAPTTSLLLPEFFYALAHADAALIRRSGSGGARRGAAQQVESAFSREEAEAGAAANDGVELDAADLGAAEEFFGDGYQDDDFGGPMDDDFEGFDAVPAQLAEPAPWTGRDAADGFDIDGQDNSYADMCRAHVEAYISAAAAAEVQTELATRVSAWRTKMAPVLEEEERRPEFDIHAYGDRVLSGLAALSVSAGGQPEGQPAGDDGSVMEAQPVTFKEVVAGAEVAAPCDVPRTFSSMLQLVNNGNLRIMKLGGSNQEFTVTLLNTVLPHKKIGEYRAPSSKEDLDMEGAVLGEATNHGGKQAAGKSSKRRKAA